MGCEMHVAREEVSPPTALTDLNTSICLHIPLATGKSREQKPEAEREPWFSASPVL